MKKDHLLKIYALISVFFLLLDQLFKYIARTNPYLKIPFGTKWIGWEYFSNTGVAFSIPFPNLILIIITPIIIIFLVHFLTKQKKISWSSFGILLIIAGAISNLIDRILFATTIDYFRILTGVINLGDVIIVAGASLLILEHWSKKEEGKGKTIK